MMQKFWTIFKISFQQEFSYPMNFIMWRVRNVIQILLVFFLWDSVFTDPGRIVFGYDRVKILTYVFGLMIVRSIILSIRSIDVAGEISRGDLSNYLLKPVSYLKYWFTRDISSKSLNFIFASVEVFLLYLLLKPPFFIQSDFVYLILFLAAIVVSLLLYFLLVFIFSMFTFWQPEQAWGFMFLLIIFSDFLGGGMLPLDILPIPFQKLLYILPFPYLLFVPIQIYLGKFPLSQAFMSLGIASLWVLVLFILVRLMWLAGLKTYRAEGR